MVSGKVLPRRGPADSGEGASARTGSAGLGDDPRVGIDQQLVRNNHFSLYLLVRTE